MNRRYLIAAELAGVVICDHGWNDTRCVNQRPPHVPFRQQNYTKRGLYRLLEDAWHARWGEATRDLEEWQRLYRRGKWINGLATDMHVVLPRSLFTELRARLREQLSKAGADIPPRLRSTEYHEATKWARR